MGSSNQSQFVARTCTCAMEGTVGWQSHHTLHGRIPMTSLVGRHISVQIGMRLRQSHRIPCLGQHQLELVLGLVLGLAGSGHSRLEEDTCNSGCLGKDLVQIHHIACGSSPWMSQLGIGMWVLAGTWRWQILHRLGPRLQHPNVRFEQQREWQRGQYKRWTSWYEANWKVIYVYDLVGLKNMRSCYDVELQDSVVIQRRGWSSPTVTTATSTFPKSTMRLFQRID